MIPNLNRRRFLKATAGATAAGLTLPITNILAAHPTPPLPPNRSDAPFKISIAEWSLHRALKAKKLSNLDFPVIAKEEFGIDAVEYVNQFFKDKANDLGYLKELKKRCDGLGVKSLLIMVDGEGQLGDPDNAKRTKAVENHHRWVTAAKHLGCHSIRVNAGSQGSWEEQAKLASDGLARLSEFGAKHGLNVIVENHGGLSSNGKWLTQVIKTVAMKNCGTLPDFGNFLVGRNEEGEPEWYDRYTGVTEMMPFAKAVSAKSHDFDANGNEKNTDFKKMMKIVHDAGYRGYIGIEYEGSRLDEYAGVMATKKLLERTFAPYAVG